MRELRSKSWRIVRAAISGFLDDNALSHAAAMAFYAATSLAPVLLIVIAIAGLVVGREAAELAVSAQLSGLLGPQGADLLKSVMQSAAKQTSGLLAGLLALATVVIGASGVFGEMQSSLNKIWKVQSSSDVVSTILRARAASLGLVAALGFLLLVSLAASAAISGLSEVINRHLPFGTILLSVINTLISLCLISILFGAIYKVLPDRALEWRDVRVGAVITAVLFTIGKSIIGWYLGTSAVASSYGAAGSLVVLLLWVFYTSATFLLGAEITRAYAVAWGSRSDLSVVVQAPSGSEGSATRPSDAQAFIAIGIVAFVAVGTAALTSMFPGRSRRRK